MPKLGIGGGLEKILGLWSGTVTAPGRALASESVKKSWAAVDSVKPGLMGCLMAWSSCLGLSLTPNHGKPVRCSCRATCPVFIFSGLVYVRIHLYNVCIWLYNVCILCISMYIMKPDKVRLQSTDFHSQLGLSCHNSHSKGWLYAFSTGWSDGQIIPHELI